MTDEELKQLAESNARSIQALADQIAKVSHTIAEIAEESRRAQEERSELRRAMIGIANLMASLDEDCPTILRKLTSIEGKVDRLLERPDAEQN